MAGRGSTAARQALTDADVAEVRAEVSAGKAVTVWFTAAAVGVPTGGSAKVVAVDEVAEGDFIQVRPAGSRDAVFCSPGELTRTRPARRSAATAQAAPGESAAPAALSAPAARARRSAGSTEPGGSVRSDTPKATGAKPTAGKPTAAKPTVAKPTAPEPAVPKPTAPQGPAAVAPAPPEPAPERQAKAARSGKRGERSGALTVSLTASADGEWTVEVLAGAKRVVPATPIQAADVAAATRSLPAPVTEVVTATLAEARRRQEERVARLREELDAAQRTLDQLGVD
ncbi:DUF6319 family protein [Pseudonocardia oroxyli]|uniref:Cell wall anchor protein n=1 Tax=Pseudonocardia oroxyli TaxID=366584 RepID=A0A1G8EBY6_PSEOR|nr:DUF6319 family protein [Pseudonocardia oroxyli]SDH67209.1 hypothetical protein SAMN05216377_1338 [Pseudonocardia oroxyli]